MKYRIQLPDGKTIITEKEGTGLYKDILTLRRYNPEDLKSVESIHDCADCTHISTPKGNQCYTITRTLKDKVRDKNLPFYPNIIIPILDELGEHCKRYKGAK